MHCHLDIVSVTIPELCMSNSIPYTAHLSQGTPQISLVKNNELSGESFNSWFCVSKEMNHQLSNICLGLESDKVTDRKKASDSLLLLLEKKAFTKQLDKNTDEKQSIKWSNLFRSVCKFGLKDTEHQLQLHEKRTQNNSRRNYTSKSSLTQLFRRVVHIANKDTLRLRCDVIVQQILIVLNKEYMLNRHGSDYSSVLLTEILKRRKMWIHLSSKSCQEFLQLFCALYTDPPEQWNEAITAQIIEKLIYIIFTQYNIHMNSLYKFFTFVLNEKMKQKTGIILDSLLSAAVLFISHMSPNYRIQTCKLGEDVTMHLFQVWKTCHRDLTKSHIVKFLHYQMATHHPFGSKTEKEGAYACDWSIWKNLLLRIHEMLQQELSQVLIYKKAYSRTSTDDSEMVNLAADVGHQVFSATCSYVDVTQPSTLSGSKRRKIEFTLQSLLDSLKETSSKVEVLPRLKMFNVMVLKYSSSFSNDEYLNILQVVQRMLSECRINDIMKWLLTLAKNLAVAGSKCKKILNSDEKSIVDVIWKNILDVAIKLIGLNNCIKESYLLIEELTHSHDYIFTNYDTILSLFMPHSHYKISDEALYALSSLLKFRCLFQCNNLVSIPQIRMQNIEPRYFVRMLLIEWLLPKQSDSSWMIRNENDSPQVNSKTYGNHGIYSPVIIAELLTHLCLKDMSKINITRKKQQIFFDQQLNDLQQSYMETTFDLPEMFDNKEYKAKNTKNIIKDNSAIETIKEAILDLVIRDCGATLEMCYHLESENINILGYQCCFIVCFIQNFIKHEVMNLYKIQKFHLTKILENMMQKLGDCLKEVMKSSKTISANIASLISTMNHLVEMIQIQDGLDPSYCKPLASYWRQATPMKILECVFDMLKFQSGNKNIRSPSKSPKKLKYTSEASDDEMVGSGDSTFEDSFEDQNKCSNIEENYCVSSFQLESDAENLRLLAVKFLSSWCIYADYSTEEFSSKMTASQVFDKVLELCSEQLDLHNYNELKLTLTFLKSFTTKEQNLSQEYVSKILEILREIFKVHEKDKDIISHCVDILSQVAYHLAASEDLNDDSNLKNNRMRLMFLLNIFWPTGNTIECSYLVCRSILNCSVEILKSNQDNWSKFESEKEGSEKNVVALPERYVWFITAKNHSIRKLAIKNCWNLLCFPKEYGKYNLQTPEYQKTIINDVLTAFKDLISSKDKSSSEDELSDLTVGKLSSLLLCCGTLLATGCHHESDILLFLCQIIHQNAVDYFLIEKVLNQISLLLKYESSSQFMKYQFKFLIHHWLKEHPLSKFPFQLLKCESVQLFYSSYAVVFIPELLFNEDLETIQEVARQLNTDEKELIRNHFSLIIARILPYEAFRNGIEIKKNTLKQSYINHAESSLKFIFEMFSLKIIDEIIDKEADSVIYHLLDLLSETANEIQVGDAILHSEYVPTQHMHSLSADILSDTINYVITTYFKNSKRYFVQVLCTKYNGIQNILLPLSLSVSNANRNCEKRRLFLMYRMFIKLIFSQFNESRFKIFRPFFLRDTIFHLANHLHTEIYDLRFSYYVIDLLHETCSVGVNFCSKDFSKYLSTILDAIIPLVLQDNIMSYKAFNLLKFLIIDNKTTLGNAIALLDPFPSSDQFSELQEILKSMKYRNGNFSLNQEFEHFLKSRKQISPSHRVEGLDHLLTQLQSKRDELRQLTHAFQNIKMLSEDVACSNIHQVICELIKLSIQKVDTAVSIAASKCLGEIGSIDLSSVFLSSNSTSLDQARHDLDYDFYRVFLILKSLDSYLTDKKITVKCAAANVLNMLMSTKLTNTFIMNIKGDEFDNLFSCLQPFIRSKSERKTPKNVLVDKVVIENENLWTPNHENHEKWITTLVCELITSGVTNDEILELLKPICRMKVDFCEQILPFIIHRILLQNDMEMHSVLSRQISRFFKEHCLSVDNHGYVKQVVNSGIVCCQKSIQTMINVIQYLRCQKHTNRSNSSSTPWTNNFWLDVDYLEIAQAAKFCSAYFASILFIEIWIENDLMTNSNNCSSEILLHETQSTSKVERIDVNKARIIQAVMSDAYSSIGENDSVYGCKFSSHIELSDRLKRYELENNWEKLISAYDLTLSSQANVTRQAGMLQVMRNFGFNHLLETYLKGVSSVKEERFQKFQYECAWRNGIWEIPYDQEDGCNEYHQLIYKGFCNLQENDIDGFYKALEQTRLLVSTSQKNINLKSSCSIYSELSKLQCVTVFEDTLNFINESKFHELEEKWKSNDELFNSNFEFVEPVLTIQCMALKLLKEKNIHPLSVRQMLQKRLQTFSKVARQAGHYQVAEKCLFDLRQMYESDGIELWQFQLEEAELMWAKMETDTAKQLLKSLLQDILRTNRLDSEFNRFYPHALTIYGKWLSETCSESPTIIMEEYFDKAVLILEGKPDSEKLPTMDTYLTLARYADLQYQNIYDYFKSPTYQTKCELIARSRQEMFRIKSLNKRTKTECEALNMHKKHIGFDEAELKALSQDKSDFLSKSIQNYIHCLRLGFEHVLPAFRLISLWFQNSSSPEISELINKSIACIPTYKFLPLMYQLAARISTNHSQAEIFQETLQKMITETTLDHPYHTLFIIFALANAPKDLKYDNDLKVASARSKNMNLMKSDNRVNAAESILKKVSDKKHMDLVNGLKIMCDSYIQFAYMENDKQNKKPVHSIPHAQSILKLNRHSCIPVPTADIEIDKSGEYSDVPCIKEIAPSYELVGGLNAPKKVKCRGTDGRMYYQLVKGKDDLRQDAVMQQFFSLVNKLLKQNSETKKRKLSMRTYKVIPLSRRSGIVQWCNGTQPFSTYLCGSKTAKGAHEIYHPTDWNINECVTKMGRVAHHNNKVRLDNYNEICKNFKPVFRHFLLENFPEPAIWFERRLAYTQSVATCSVVGYILGLGDRHMHNILIDNKTAEFIHIDLGIAFEQGKLLPTPETVPFRLTRDVVDGMGIMGVEGVFRRCCEKTMKVMHDSQEVLLTIPQVLLYDPLYKWLVSQEKVAKVQGTNSTQLDSTQSGITSSATNSKNVNISALNDDLKEGPEINKVAERVLLRLKEKLQGVEKGTAMSVSGQVNHLIQEAIDPNNLSRIYHGWRPFL
ncbi:Serine-protein kinase ATM [Nymphon striatum]|nr:Serine-protein kinase ATM [Nymphon striatum]